MPERWAHFRDGHSEQAADGEWVKVEDYERQAAATQKLSEALVLTTRDLAVIATMDENSQQASVAAGSQQRAKAMMEEALAFLES